MHACGIICIRCNPLKLKPLTVRIPEKLEKEILEASKHMKLDKATVVRTLLKMGIKEWRKQTALELLRNGKVTFAKAAEIAKLSLWELADLVKQRNVEWVGEDETMETTVKKTKKKGFGILKELTPFTATDELHSHN